MNFDLNRLIRENIKNLKPYSSARSEFSGAASVFLSNGNGFTFDLSDRQKLIDCFNRINSMTSDELFEQGRASNILAQQITPSRWARTLLES